VTARAPELNWQTAKSPSLADIEALAWAAFEALPPEFRALCGDVVLLVDEVADAETLASVGLDNELELSGLFTGIALPHQEGTSLPRLPNTVHLYRLPLLVEWAESEVELGVLVNHVLVHEIGHHFGFSDEDMHAIEARAGD
jgi:predicted Zn-dependent protease with MMP-like domain